MADAWRRSVKIVAADLQLLQAGHSEPYAIVDTFIGLVIWRWSDINDRA